MKAGRNITELFGEVAKVLLLVFLLVAGLVAGRLVLHALGMTIPRLPMQADEAGAIIYLLSGAFILTLGWIPLAKSITGNWKIRTVILFVFLFMAFNIGVTVESAIYSDVEKYHQTIWILLLPVLLFSIAAGMIYKTEDKPGKFSRLMINFFRNRALRHWPTRILLGLLSFPVVYFFFGILVSPFVMDYYAETIQGLNLPETTTIFSIQLLRSFIFLLISVPVMIFWGKSKKQLVFALGLAHFVMVFGYDIFLAIQMPSALVLIHGIEIMLDSFVYAFFLVWLIYPYSSSDTNREPPVISKPA